MRAMLHRNLQRSARAMLLVLLASFLSPSFAQGTVTAAHGGHAHADRTEAPAGHDEAQHEGDHAHRHGHALDEHDNLGHALGHLPASTVEFSTALPAPIASYPPAGRAMSLATAQPGAVFRPPRVDFRP